MSRCHAKAGLGLSVAVLALAAGLVATPASAANECGTQTGATLTCASTGNPYASGITYLPTQNFTLDLASGVIVDPTSASAHALTVGSTSSPYSITIDGVGSSLTTGAASAVVVATGTGAIQLDLGSIQTTGASAVGINVASTSGAVSVAAQSIATAGASANGITAASTSGTVSVANDGPISTSGATAYGISAKGAAGVTIDGTGSITTIGSGAIGVLASSGAGDTQIDLGSISTAGTGAYGIDTASTTGNVSISAQSISTTGSGADGIFADTTGTGNIAVAARSITTTGTGASGIAAASGGGSIAVTDSGTIATSGEDGYGIYAHGATGVTVGGGGNVSTTGEDTIGVLAETPAGNVSVDLGAVQTTGSSAYGVDTVATAGNIAIATKAIATAGTAADAIIASAKAGTVSITNDGTITTSGTSALGIDASGSAGVTIVGQGSVATTGDDADAIDVASTAGAVNVTQATVTTSGANSIGIQANAETDSSVTVGSVTASGTGATAISTYSATGNSTVSIGGAVSSANARGVTIDANGLATLNVAAGASLNGASGSAVIESGTGTLIDNAGTIGPAGATTLAVATITAAGGAVTITNSGTINGSLSLSAGDDVVTNTGVFNAVAISKFASGNDLFDNQGTFNVAPSATAATTIEMQSLETFRNAGTVSFENGHVGDLLGIQGNYVGAGGRMLLDIDPSNLAGSDSMLVSGTTSGNTIVSLNPINDKTLLLNYGTPIVTVGAASAAGAFTLDPAEQGHSGLVALGIKYDAANLSYDLVAMPGDAAYRTLAISEGARNLWAQSADAWSAHMQQYWDLQFMAPDRPRSTVWGQIVGGRQTRDFDETNTLFGISRPVRVDYAQDETGAQFGVDLRTEAAGTRIYGLTGGYLHSTLDYDGVGDHVSFDDVNVGAYLGYRSGRVFLNLLGKYDHYWAHDTSVSGGYSTTLSGSIYGGQAEVGVRLGRQSLFFEPHLVIAANHSQIEDFTVAQGKFSFDDPNGLSLKAGGRIGTALDLGAHTSATFYVRANYVDTLIGKDSVVFSSGGTDAALQMKAASPYSEGAIGMTVSLGHRIGLGTEGRYAKGGDSDGFGGRLTLSSGF